MIRELLNKIGGVHDKAIEIQVAIPESANISARIENKSRWTTLAIWPTMLATPRIMPALSSVMLAISSSMLAIRRVQDIPRLVQVAFEHGRRTLWQEIY